MSTNLSSMTLTSSEFPKRSDLVFPGTHKPRGLHVDFYGTRHLVRWKPSNYLLELVAVYLEDPGESLFNEDSISCHRVGRDGLLLDCDEVARDQSRHLRKILGESLKTGRKSYRLSEAIGNIVVSRRVLNFPQELVDNRIIERLRVAMIQRADATLET